MEYLWEPPPGPQWYDDPLAEIAALPARFRAAQARVTFADMRTLLDSGIPIHDLLRPYGLAFGIVQIQGRRLVVTNDRRLLAYLEGPMMVALPPSAGNLSDE